MPRFATRFRRDRSGATAIEYALIAALVAVIVATAIGALGTRLAATFQTASDAIP
jgi:pilus assembly protein Flp/PilA